jgi:hypothetical protein
MMYRLLSFGRTAFDASENGLRPVPTIGRGLSVALAVCGLVWFLNPDLFGLVPNSLDPMFYTGYAINLDDALAVAGNRHYFVTRWSSYLPMYLFSEIFGPYWGRLLLRLALIITLAEVFWRFTHRYQIRPVSRLLGIFVLVTTPMFVRAFTTDYPEHFIIWGTIVMLLIALMGSRKYSHSLILGTLAALVTIANPTALIVTSLILLVYSILLFRDEGATTALGRVLLAGTAASATFLFGYVLFRFYYDIGNVYEPTLWFIRNFVPPEKDGWVAPNKEWLGYFGWIYLPPILCVLSLIGTNRNRKVGVPTGALTLLVAAIYLIHVIREIQTGYMLEVSYYWSLLLSPVLILFVFLLINLVSDLSWHWPVSVMALTLLLLKSEALQSLRLPSGIALFVVLTCFLGVSTILIRRQKKLSVLFLSLGFLWIQIGSPIYTNRTNSGDLNTPNYDRVYGQAADASRAVLDETIWFTETMDLIPNDEASTFLTAGGWTSSIVGTYISHPFSRWITSRSESNVLTENARDELNFNFRPNLIIYGDPSEVQDLFNRVSLELPQLTKTLDVVNPAGLGYRLLAIDGNAKKTAEHVFPLSRFERTIGTTGIDGSVFVDSRSNWGFVSFGPYFGLGQGTYEAELAFDSRGTSLIGRFEAFNDQTGKAVTARINNMPGGKKTIKVRFTSFGEGSTWQLRTVYEGGEAATFQTITLKKLD